MTGSSGSRDRDVRCLLDAEPDPLVTMPECPDTCEETQILLVHLQ